LISKQITKQSVINVILLLPGIVAVCYAVVTGLSRGEDLLTFYQRGEAWLAGASDVSSVPGRLYPPFAPPLFAVLTVLRFEHAVVVWLLINLIALLVTIYFAHKLIASSENARSLLFLAAFFLTWAPVRVTLRLGQNSLVITALILGALLARQKQQKVAGGLLLGLSLVKYSLSLPFFLYLLWKREWKMILSSLALMTFLTGVYAWHLEISPIKALTDGLGLVRNVQLTASGYTGTTEIRLLILDLFGGNELAASALTTGFTLAALLAMAIVFVRKPEDEPIHFALLSLFALWTTYHRVYDSVLCIIPAAMLMDYYLRKRFPRFRVFWLCGLGLLIVSVPGLLTERMKISAGELSATPAGFAGLHVERVLMFGLFWSLVWLAWNKEPARRSTQECPAE
jgi:hypothetical protein